jgi:hypothetical protein
MLIDSIAACFYALPDALYNITESPSTYQLPACRFPVGLSQTPQRDSRSFVHRRKAPGACDESEMPPISTYAHIASIPTRFAAHLRVPWRRHFNRSFDMALAYYRALSSSQSRARAYRCGIPPTSCHRNSESRKCWRYPYEMRGQKLS